MQRLKTGILFLLIGWLWLGDAEGAPRTKKPSAPKISTCEVFGRILSDASPEQAGRTILISNRDWWDHSHPFPPELFQKLRKQGKRFIVVGNAYKAYKEKPEFEIKDSKYDPKTDLYFYSDDFSSGMGNNWTRDYGPHSLIDENGQRFLLFHKTPTMENNPMVEAAKGGEDFAKKISKFTSLPIKNIDVVYQGGHVVPISTGLLILSRDLLRFNKGMTEKSIEAEFQKVGGLNNFLWVDPLPNESTGHSDIFIKDLGGGKVLLSDSDDPKQKKALEKVKGALQKEGLKVLRLKNSPPQGTMNFSYANSLILGDAVIMPTYKKPKWDQKAIEFYRKQGFKVYPVDMSAAAEAGGSTHCATCEVQEADTTAPQTKGKP